MSTKEEDNSKESEEPDYDEDKDQLEEKQEEETGCKCELIHIWPKIQQIVMQLLYFRCKRSRSIQIFFLYFWYLPTKIETQRKRSSVPQWIGISKILLVWNDIRYYRLCFLLP